MSRSGRQIVIPRASPTTGATTAVGTHGQRASSAVSLESRPQVRGPVPWDASGGAGCSRTSPMDSWFHPYGATGPEDLPPVRVPHLPSREASDGSGPSYPPYLKYCRQGFFRVDDDRTDPNRRGVWSEGPYRGSRVTPPSTLSSERELLNLNPPCLYPFSITGKGH